METSDIRMALIGAAAVALCGWPFDDFKEKSHRITDFRTHPAVVEDKVKVKVPNSQKNGLAFVPQSDSAIMYHVQLPAKPGTIRPVAVRDNSCDSPPEAETGAPRTHRAHVGQEFDTTPIFKTNIQTYDFSQIWCYSVTPVNADERR
jgi:hypothetical protein